MQIQHLICRRDGKMEDKNSIETIQKIACEEERFHAIADVFKQLGDTSRIQIYWLLCHCEKCVSDIASMLDMSSPAVSHHLKQLKDGGLVTSQRTGKEVYYRASSRTHSLLLHQIIEQVMHIACPNLQSLPEGLDHSHSECSPESCCHINYSSADRNDLTTINEIHSMLVEHLDRHWTIEELAKTYLMNPTTLKTRFRNTYGISIAAHIRQHRMEEAARLLTQTSLNIGDIALKVGYESQSKFTSAFKKHFGILPKDYRNEKNNG